MFIFKNLIQAKIVYVKDFYDEFGNAISEEYLLKRLLCRRNWIMEYLTVKNVCLQICNKT